MEAFKVAEAVEAAKADVTNVVEQVAASSSRQTEESRHNEFVDWWSRDLLGEATPPWCPTDDSITPKMDAKTQLKKKKMDVTTQLKKKTTRSSTTKKKTTTSTKTTTATKRRRSPPPSSESSDEEPKKKKVNIAQRQRKFCCCRSRPGRGISRRRFRSWSNKRGEKRYRPPRTPMCVGKLKDCRELEAMADAKEALVKENQELQVKVRLLQAKLDVWEGHQ